ncbi:MAG TPA: DUF4097 family beta strand repeat-containing protein [Longimicrobiales bacterium]|nr:DUF4097 family beta strand repeat-containing protein [Longimicrobiales bacterium]
MSLMRFSYTLLALLSIAAPATAQDWSWHKALASGKTIEIKGINGDITAQAATGNEVEVVARKSAKRSDPDDVKIEVVESANGFTICALYPDARRGEANECQPGRGGRMNNRNNDTEVDFEVRLPRGVHFSGRTVNGSVRATGLTARVVGHTVNGGVRISTTGLAEASTVNGGVNVRMGQTNWTDDLAFSTVNGSITLEMPGQLDTDVQASTVNGSISTDWPLTVRGKWGPRRMNGRIGNGGRDLELSTVNGDIEIRKTGS